MSKRSIIFLLVAGVFLVVLGLGYARMYQMQTTDMLSFERNTDEYESARIKQAVVVDTDGDGLRDWEEQLWGTDVQNPDTDGDGTNDVGEVRDGRDPLKAGPGDEVKKEPSEGTGPGESAPATLTDAMTRLFAEAYVVLGETGDISESSQAQLYEAFKGRVSAQRETGASAWTAQNIRLAQTDAERTAYRPRLTEISNKYKSYTGSPLVLVKELAELKNEKTRERLARLADAYANLADDLSAVSAPVSIAETHAGMLNTYYALAEAIRDMSTADTDPLRAMAGIVNYQKHITTLADILTVLNKFLGTI